jgi:hypothetical protein
MAQPETQQWGEAYQKNQPTHISPFSIRPTELYFYDHDLTFLLIFIA